LAVKLRLTRKGKKKQPFYRIVATDSRTRRDGKYIDRIGYYNPLANPSEIVIDEEKAFYWLKNGAIPSDTVKSLFSQKGIMLKWHYMKQHDLDEAKVEEEYKRWELLQLERQKREEALAAQAKREQEIPSAEESAPEMKEESVPESKEEIEESPAADKEQTAESQSEEQAQQQQPEKPHAEEQQPDVQKTNEPDESKEK